MEEREMPNLEQIQQEIDTEDRKTKEVEIKQEGKKKSKRIFRLIIIGLLCVAIILAGVVFIQDSKMKRYEGMGSISGNVVNLELTPIPAEISVLNTKLSTLADDTGKFSLINIPAGSASVIIAYEGQGVEIPVMVIPDQNVNLGQITIEGTQIPGE